MALRTPLPVQPNLYMTDTAGRPLDGGRVYFGESGKDPEIYPIDIFYDELLTIAALQPVITKNGFLSASGDIVGIYGTANSYSVKVLDANNVQVLYLPSMTNSDSFVSLLNAEIERSTQEAQVIKQDLSAINTDLTQTKSALEAKNAELQGQINSVGGGKFAYTTYAKMVAAAALPAEDPLKLPANASIDVTNDTDASKNGAYSYDGTTFTKSTYDPLALSKNYTDDAKEDAIADTENKIKEIAEQATERKNLAELQDVNGQTYAKFDDRAELHLVGMGQSVQESIKGSPQYDKSTDLLLLNDANGNPVVRISDNGSLFIPKLKGSVQDAINSKTESTQESAILVDKFRTPAEKQFLAPVVAPYINNLVANKTDYHKAPISLLPASYTLPNDIINKITAVHPAQRLTIDTPYFTDDQVVHPNVVECVGGIRGYKYLMCINPYKNENDQYENPVIYGSNDLDNWEMLTDFVQPLDTPPSGGFLSDNGFAYDPINGDLICYWRSTIRLPVPHTQYVCRRTKDCITWTDKEVIYPETSKDIESLTSPTILYDPRTGLWNMWNLEGTSSVVRHRTAKELDGVWSDYTEIITSDFRHWHLEVKWVGDKFLMLLHSRFRNNFYLGISDDGASWIFSNNAIFSTAVPESYKGSMIPSFDVNGDFYMDLVYTADTFRLFHTTTNSINIEAAL